MSPPVVLLGLLVGGATLLVVSAGVATLALRPPRFPERATPAERGLQGEPIAFASLDGLPLRGWWFASAREGGGTIILCHGHGMSHGMMLRYVPFLQQAGFNVLAFDFRGRGASGGEATSVGFFEAGDLLGAVRWVRDRGGGPIGVYGVSMGAAVAIRGAAACEQIEAVVAESPYARLTWAMASYLATFLTPLGLLLFPGAYLAGQRQAGFRLSLCAPLDLVARISPRPLLLIHGTWDTVVLPFHSRLLFAAAGEPKQLWPAPRSWHIRAHRDHREEFERRVTAFFQQALHAPAARRKPAGPGEWETDSATP